MGILLHREFEVSSYSSHVMLYHSICYSIHLYVDVLNTSKYSRATVHWNYLKCIPTYSNLPPFHRIVITWWTLPNRFRLFVFFFKNVKQVKPGPVLNLQTRRLPSLDNSFSYQPLWRPDVASLLEHGDGGPRCKLFQTKRWVLLYNNW